jgi:hypothetical protein
MARLQRAFIRLLLLAYVLASVATLIWAPIFFWLLTGLAGAYWTARFMMWLDRKLFQRSNGARITHWKVQRKIDTLPDPVAKLFGGKTEL